MFPFWWANESGGGESAGGGGDGSDGWLGATRTEIPLSASVTFFGSLCWVALDVPVTFMKDSFSWFVRGAGSARAAGRGAFPAFASATFAINSMIEVGDGSAPGAQSASSADWAATPALGFVTPARAQIGSEACVLLRCS